MAAQLQLARLTRRHFLSVAMGAGIAGAFNSTPLAMDAEPMTLAETAHSRDLTFGVATSDHDLTANPVLSDLVSKETSLVVPENEGKWSVLRPKPEIVDTNRLDRLVTFAEHRSLAIRGHTLVWHEQMPSWVLMRIAEGSTRDACRLMTEHIHMIMKRYRGRIQSWDVVNEGIEPDHGRYGGLRDTPWLNAMGPDYIAWAFEAARDGDPSARLTYNEYGLEYARPWNRARRDATLRLLQNLHDRGLIDALGIQGHLFIGEPFDASELRSFLAAVAALDLEIYVTELDVCDKAVDGSQSERDAAICEHLAAVLSPVLEEKSVRCLVTWGVMTNMSWLNEHPSFRRTDGNTTRGLPFDEAGRLTPMGRTLTDLLGKAPLRHVSPG